ncbi:MAG: hypothetical protein LAN37_07735 [Acidobacteriia bacterium]|nr:hypothetical protein [Terriglobia bacterium]
MLKASLNRLRGAKILDPDVERAEQVFLAPPFTPEIAAAVSLISTRLPIRADERSRLLCQTTANAMSEREYEALAPLFGQMPKPQRVLEIGPGIGRSVVHFSKRGVWGEHAEVHLYDANGAETKYKGKHYDRPPQWPDVSSFCGNLPLLRCFLDYNHMANCRIFDAAALPLRQLPGPYELIYAFFSIGFHWSLEFYLDDLDPLLGKRSVLVCTLNKHFRPFARLREFSTRILYCREIKKNAAPLRLLALGKGDLPEVGVTLAEAFPRSKL